MRYSEDGAAPHWTAVDWYPVTHDALVDGRRIRYVDYGSGPALVLLHGMGASWQWWLENIPTLGRRHRIVAVDIPGFGNSEPLPAPAELTTHASAIARLLGQLGIGSATVAGHSMGGLIALTMADVEPDLVANLVLVDAGGVPMTERRLRTVLTMLRVFSLALRSRLLRRALATKRGLRRLVLRPAFRDPDDLSDELAAVTMPLLNAPGFVDAVAASGRGVRNSAPERIACPVLLLWGEHDPLAPLHCAVDMHARLRDSELVVISGAGHTPAIERPREVNDAILGFLQAHSH